MSRGLGERQRAVVRALRDAGEGLRPYEIRQKLGIGTKDRSNVRRVLRTLEDRGLAEQDEAGRWRLNPDKWFWAAFMDVLPQIEEDRRRKQEERREQRRAFEKWAAVRRADRKEEWRAYWEREELWERPAPEYQRRTMPTQNQYFVLAVLEEFAEELEEGLSERAIRRAALDRIGDRANVKQAIDSLVKRGYLQRSKAGQRLRIRTFRIPIGHRINDYVLWDHCYAGYLEEPLDTPRVEAVLQSFGEI